MELKTPSISGAREGELLLAICGQAETEVKISNLKVTATLIPEPSMFAFVFGLIGVALVGGRRRRK